MNYIVESACAISLSIILERIVIFRMPFGGSITLGQPLPLILLSNKLGSKAGFFASIMYSIVHLILWFKLPPAKTFCSFVIILLLDYILPYVFFGLSSIFGMKLKNKTFKLYFSTLCSFILRWIISIISGVIFWSDYIPFNLGVWSYCIIYNSFYIIPECIISLVILKHLIKFL